MNQPATPSASVLAGLRQALRPHAPFSAMGDDELEAIVRASRLQYFAPGETVLVPAATAPASCYIVRQGIVRGERPGVSGESAALWELTAGEMFPLGALLSRRPVTTVYRATRDTFCFVVPAGFFDSLVASSPVFHDFCTRRLAHLLDLSRAQLQAEYAANATEERGLATPLQNIVRKDAVSCSPETGLHEVLKLMEDRRIGSMPVVDGERRPIGIFTRRDVIGRVVLPQRPLSVPIDAVMSAPVVTLPLAATAGDAALLMARRGIRHVAVVDAEGRLRGVVSERDLFTLQRLSGRELASTIRRAPDVSTLIQCAADVRALSFALVAQGVGAGQLTRMISSLNDQITVRILELLSPAHDLAGLSLCWLGMGSDGRGEQTIATDQDNGLIFASDRDDLAADEVRERLLPLAGAVNDALDRCGYPLCRGGVMAMNPRWCASLDEWKSAFTRWIEHGDPDSLLSANVFFDFRALWGDAGLADALRADITQLAQANQRFLKQMTDNALRNRPPLNWLGELQAAEELGGEAGIDLKLHGSLPFVDGARIYALASGSAAINTVERFVDAGGRQGIPAAEIRSWCDAFEYIQLLRLREQHRKAAAGAARAGDGAANVVPLAALPDLDRRILKEAMRQVRKLQQRLQLDYPG